MVPAHLSDVLCDYLAVKSRFLACVEDCEDQFLYHSFLHSLIIHVCEVDVVHLFNYELPLCLRKEDILVCITISILFEVGSN